MPSIDKIFVIGVFFFIFTSTHAVAEDAEGKGSSVVGTVVEQDELWYAIVKTARGAKKLYIKGDIFCSEVKISHCLRIQDIKRDLLELKEVGSKKVFTIRPGERIPLEGPDLIFEKAVASGVIEYRYNDTPGAKKGQIEDFTVRSMEREKIVVEKDYDKSYLPQDLTEQEKKLFEAPDVQSENSEKIKASIFEQIEVEKIGPDAWAVNAEKADMALSNIGRSLFSVIRGVSPRYRFGEGPGLRFNSELGDAIVNKDGFLVQNLAVGKIVERAGIRQGDLIRSINGQRVNSLFGIYRAYMKIKSEPSIKMVNVEIIRDETPRVLRYKVK